MTIEILKYDEFKKKVKKISLNSGYTQFEIKINNLSIIRNDYPNYLIENIADEDFLIKDLYKYYISNILGFKYDKSLHWDIYVDERKDKPPVSDVGFLCIARNLSSQAYRILIKIKNDVKQKFNKNNVKEELKKGIGEIHWNSLDAGKFQVAIKWLEEFFKCPMMFFIYYPQQKNKKNRTEIIKEVIKRLEKDKRVPGGLNREKATIHVDFDDNDINELWQLERFFRMLRVFPWDSKGSPLIQLTDILLNISYYNYNKNIYKKINSNSKMGAYKQQLIQLSKKYFDEIKKHKNNIVVYNELIEVK